MKIKKSKFPPPPPLKEPQNNYRMPVFTSLDQAANTSGVPVDILRQSKKDGCPAFALNKIYLQRFLLWYFQKELGPEENVNWIRRDKRAKALIAETKLGRLNGLTWDANAVRRFIYSIVHDVFCAELDRMANEYPATLKGRSEVEIRKEVLRQKEICKKTLGQKLEEMEQIGEAEDEAE